MNVTTLIESLITGIAGNINVNITLYPYGRGYINVDDIKNPERNFQIEFRVDEKDNGFPDFEEAMLQLENILMSHSEEDHDIWDRIDTEYRDEFGD